MMFQKLAFLDTNTLHYIGIYLEYAKENGLFPNVAQNATKEKDSAVESLNNLAEVDLRKSLKRGLETVYFLSTNDVQVQYAPISELELLTGRTKGKAIVSAAREGVPDRMWSHFREDEIRERVTLTDLVDVKDKVDGLTSILQESGVAVKTRRSDQTNEVLELAKGVNGLVYMEAVDSIIYASALVAQADYLFTSDGYLKKTVNSIHNPNGESRHEEIRRKLQQLVSRIILGRADAVELPSAHTITADGKLEPKFSISGSDGSV
ncbi:MAG: hypothetical protein F4201_01670 [Nitrospira sp. SB0677_bin_15]|nr:hypothetical protein [Nitrospira sp. SB0667_bin_9]MYD30861.1 hypothetical protein [Nitrospira sp. SB0661_bin_20]MYG39524.1 hypothetical protein [Nitrospira sp. SB0677_bin_15]